MFRKIISEIHPIFRIKALTVIALLLKNITSRKPSRTVLSKESNLKLRKYSKNVRLSTIFLSHRLIVKNINCNPTLLKILKLSLSNAIYLRMHLKFSSCRSRSAKRNKQRKFKKAPKNLYSKKRKLKKLIWKTKTKRIWWLKA